MINWNHILLAAIGGGTGSALRFLISLLLTTPAHSFPKATLLVNIAGSAFIGFFFGMLQKHQISSATYVLLATGFCGGFTTFSAISLEALNLLKAQQYQLVAYYILSSIIFGVAAAFAAYQLSRSI